jgi:WD40 repeat protein
MLLNAFGVLLAAFCILGSLATASRAQTPTPIATINRNTPVSFEQEILPIFRKNCLACHSESEGYGELVLETPEAILKGGDTGPAVIPGKGSESLLVKLAARQDEPLMPPDDNDVAAKLLTPQELGLIRLWIDQGAKGSTQGGVMSPQQWRPLPPGTHPIYAVAVTEDGQFAACGRANQIFIYHVSTGELVTRLTDPALQAASKDERPGIAHLDVVQSLAFNSQGDMLASGGFRTVKLWRYPRDVQRLKLAAATGDVTAVAVSPDTKTLATGAADNSIKLWDSQTGQLITTLHGHTAAVSGLRFSSDGAQVHSGSADKTIRVWNVLEGQLAGRIDTPTEISSIATLVLAPAGNEAAASSTEEGPTAGGEPKVVEQIVSGGGDNLIRLWKVPQGLPQPLPHAPPNARVLAVSPDRKLLAMGGSQGTISVIDFHSGGIIKTWQAHKGAIQDISFGPATDDKEGQTTGLLASAGADRTVRTWNYAAGEMVTEFDGTESALESVAFQPDGKRVAAGAADGTVVIFSLEALKQQAHENADEDAETSAVVLRLSGMTQKVTAVRFSDNGQTIYTACMDGTVRGFAAADGQQRFSANHGAPVHDLAISNDGQRLASAGDNKIVRLWNPANGATLQPSQLTGFTSAVHSVCFSADSEHLIAGTESGELLVFGAKDGSLQQLLTGQTGAVKAIVAAPDAADDRVVSVSADGAVRNWQLLALGSIAGHSKPVTSLATRQDEPSDVVSGSSDGTVRRWNSATGQLIRQINHGGPVTAVDVRGDGQRIASASSNKIAKLWNAANGQQLAEMRGDLRAKTLVAKLTQQKTAATAKVAAAKKVVEAAEKDLPVKTEAEKKAAEALAAAKKDVETKTAALASASTAKISAEQSAIEAAAAAQKAAQEMERMKQLAAEAAEKSKLLAEKAAQTRATAQADPNNTSLAKAAEAASMTAGAAEAEAKAAESATAAPTQAATKAAQAATAAANQAVATSKPFTDAAGALAKAETAQKAALQVHEIAGRDLEQAKAAVPEAKNALAKAESLLKQIENDLAAATKTEAEASQPLHAIAFSPDGRTVATGGDFGVIHTWDADDGTAVSSYAGHTAPIRALAYASQDELVSGSADKAAAVWDLNPSWRLERVIGDIRDPSLLVDRVAALDFSPDDQLLATGGGVPSRNGEVKIWNVADGSLVRSIPEAHTDTVNAVEFSRDGVYLASASSDKYVKKLDVATGEQLFQFEGHTDHVLGVSWRAGGRMLASCAADGTIRTWNADTGDRMRSITGYNKQVTGVRFIGQTQFTISCSGDRIVRMHNSDNGGTQRNFSGAADYMYCIDATPDPTAGIIAAGGHDGILRIWKTGNAQVLQTIGPPEEPNIEPQLAETNN